MLKSTIKIEKIYGQKLIQLIFDDGAQIDDLKLFLLDCLKEVGKIEDEYNTKASAIDEKNEQEGEE